MASKLWVDKYRPSTIDQLDYHENLGNILERLSTSGDLPHLLFYGPSGAGKKTRVLALLNSVFGAGVNKVKCEVRNFKAGTVNVEISILQSNFHIDMTPSDVAHRDKIVVQQILKEIGSSKNPNQVSFKVVILNQADSLSDEAQAALRRTLEKYTATTRVIMICNSLCRVIAPLRSRCLSVRVPAPSPEDMKRVLRKIAQNEGLELPGALENKIVIASNRNIRRAIMMMQTVYIQNSRLTPEANVPLPEWEKYLKEIAHNVLEEQTPKSLKIVRGKLYEVLASCIPATTVFNTLCKELVTRSDSSIKSSIVFHAANYELQMKSGSKPIVHIEAFLARFMSLFKQHMNRLMMNY